MTDRQTDRQIYRHSHRRTDTDMTDMTDIHHRQTDITDIHDRQTSTHTVTNTTEETTSRQTRYERQADKTDG